MIWELGQAAGSHYFIQTSPLQKDFVSLPHVCASHAGVYCRGGLRAFRNVALRLILGLERVALAWHRM